MTPQESQFIIFRFSFALRLSFKPDLLPIKDLTIIQEVKLVRKQYLKFFYFEPKVKFILSKIRIEECLDFFIFIAHFEKAELGT